VIILSICGLISSFSYFDLLFYGAPQSRDGSYLSLPVILMNKNIGNIETRGQLKAIGQIHGGGVTTDKILTISGTNISFLAINHGSSSNSYVFGPFSL
jgi:hypothetical protein